MNVVFLHPDLGLGGAERLIVDAATWLRAAGHRVIVITAHHDTARSFPETTDGSLEVRVRGGSIPPQVLGRLRAPCAIARMAWGALAVRRLDVEPDVVICDLVAHAIPVLKRAARVPVLFYCHHPDRLLTPRRRGAYAWYRVPIDRLEEHATGMADRVLVNSRFTAARFRDAFPRLRDVTPIVLHPGVDPIPCPDLSPDPGPGPLVLLVLSRFDPRKNLHLAIDALALVRARLAPDRFAAVRLVLAGSCDVRLREQVETAAALESHAARLGLAGQIVIRRSPDERERRSLLSACRGVVYTPLDEHFGYVPLEAMAAGRPVVAVNRGGPLETVVHGETGFLCPPDPAAFAAALARIVADPGGAARLGRAGRAHVATHFTRDAFGRGLETVLHELTCSPS